MTLQALIEKIKRYPLPTLCGLIVLICAVYFNFRVEMLTELQIQRDEAIRQAGQMDENLVASASRDQSIAGNASLAENLQKMKEHLEKLEDRIVRSSELEVNYGYFYRLESETGVSLADLSQSGPVAPAKGVAKTAFVPVGYNLIISGRFSRIIAYLDELENGERFYRLKSFNLQRGREVDQTAVTIALNLELLGQP